MKITGIRLHYYGFFNNLDRSEQKDTNREEEFGVPAEQIKVTVLDNEIDMKSVRVALGKRLYKVIRNHLSPKIILNGLSVSLAQLREMVVKEFPGVPITALKIEMLDRKMAIVDYSVHAKKLLGIKV